MRAKISGFFVFILIIFTQIFFEPTSNTVIAQSSYFSLISPFYGTASINSFFDHEYPDYGQNHQLVKFNGQLFETDGPDYATDKCMIDVDGNKQCYDGHDGYDFGLVFDRVLAAASGSVVFVGWANNMDHGSSYGLEIIIKHTGQSQEVYRTYYGHLSVAAVQLGQYVTAGQVIGTSGNSGGSSGPHLHFSVSKCFDENGNCNNDGLFRKLDPFGWQPESGAPVQQDPWHQLYGDSAFSWCMWRDGQFVNYCYPYRPSNPMNPPFSGPDQYIYDTTNNSSGFSKGFNNFGSNLCSGTGTVDHDSPCREWFETPDVGFQGTQTYRTLMNGKQPDLGGDWTTIDNWAKYTMIYAPGDYEIFVWVPSNMGDPGNTYTWQAHYGIIDYSNTQYEMVVDEYYVGTAQNQRNRWLSLGVHRMSSNSFVYLIDTGEDPIYQHCPTGYLLDNQRWCRVAVDDLRFVQIKKQEDFRAYPSKIKGFLLENILAEKFN